MNRAIFIEAIFRLAVFAFAEMRVVKGKLKPMPRKKAKN